MIFTARVTKVTTTTILLANLYKTDWFTFESVEKPKPKKVKRQQAGSNKKYKKNEQTLSALEYKDLLF